MKRIPKKAMRAALIALLSVAVLGTSVTALANDTTIEISDGKNSAPIAENLELTTYRGVEAAGKFKAVDPDGDSVTFEITGMPKKGAASLCEGGGFSYAPEESARGKDSFTYVAVDSRGAVSKPATVTVSIKKQNTKITYSDMSGNDAEYSALVLAENGVFTGEKMGGKYFFRPDEEVSRGEFLAMCMSVAGTETLDGVSRTGFFDDAEIPMWVKPYVSAALLGGMISGYRDSMGRPVFNAGAAITFSEAAVVLNNALGITDVYSVGAFQPENLAVPVWAQTASANLVSCNILPSGLAGVSAEAITRADAAKLLSGAIDVVNARAGESGLLSWLK
ncbi:MAG: S-layer homology domain-containing protein [Oscillospiraceae bacterium]|jgi:hypothetical protein|nr:S-layer homology domain-containing protein [Oscillospiraceae bacterium]